MDYEKIIIEKWLQQKNIFWIGGTTPSMRKQLKNRAVLDLVVHLQLHYL